jgi:arginyl-tRNA synthetase
MGDQMMGAENPFAEFRKQCETCLVVVMKNKFPKIGEVSGVGVSSIVRSSMEKPPNPLFGQLASSLCFELSKVLHQKPISVAELLIQDIDISSFSLIERVAIAGSGYVNFHLNFEKFSVLTLNSVKESGSDYGFIKTEAPINTIVEHTSVNPLHPIHIGQARNPILGDALARILKKRGHPVSVHYYIDDVGRQSSVIAYGYKKLGRPSSDEKPDHFIGNIYTLTSCLVELNRIKRVLQTKGESLTTEDSAKLNKELNEWGAIAEELQGKFPAMFNSLKLRIGEDENPEEEINKLNRAYEQDNADSKELVRYVSDLCLEGFKETQRRVKVFYDSWDWESDFVWNGQVTKVLKDLKNSKFVYDEEGVLEFDASKAVQDLNLRAKLGLREGQEVTPLTLVRADGTTLYTTRDVAYTLWKFTLADKVVNVIGMEQSLAQLQLKIALHALGYGKFADNFIHFAYNLVTLPGYKMSSRRGHYITFDEVLDEAIKRAYEEVSKRSPGLSEEEKQKIANFVGIGAVRYALVDVDTNKQVIFSWDRVLNFETNSAPYVQYTHARACSILRKIPADNIQAQYAALLKEKIEKDLILAIANFPDTFVEAAEFLKPNLIADFTNGLADKFNTFYNALPVIKAESPELSKARVELTWAVKTVISNALNLIGIEAPERM